MDYSGFGWIGWGMIGLIGLMTVLIAVGADPGPGDDPLDPDIFS